jgi:hypothetical protein
VLEAFEPVQRGPYDLLRSKPIARKLKQQYRPIMLERAFCEPSRQDPFVVRA